MKRRGELKLIEQAIRQGWQITPKGREDALALVSEVIADDSASHRELLRACKAAIAMSEHNMLADGDAELLAMVQRIGRLLDDATDE